jgi:hypothetical protein
MPALFHLEGKGALYPRTPVPCFRNDFALPDLVEFPPENVVVDVVHFCYLSRIACNRRRLAVVLPPTPRRCRRIVRLLHAAQMMGTTSEFLKGGHSAKTRKHSTHARYMARHLARNLFLDHPYRLRFGKGVRSMDDETHHTYYSSVMARNNLSGSSEAACGKKDVYLTQRRKRRNVLHAVVLLVAGLFAGLSPMS